MEHTVSRFSPHFGTRNPPLRKTKTQTTFSILVLNTPHPPPIINVVPHPGVISSSSTLTTGGGQNEERSNSFGKRCLKIAFPQRRISKVILQVQQAQKRGSPPKPTASLRSVPILAFSPPKVVWKVSVGPLPANLTTQALKKHPKKPQGQ